MKKCKMFAKIDIAKMYEFVDEAVKRIGGSIMSFRPRKHDVLFNLSCCDIGRVEDFVNQRMGHYAYPWISYITAPNSLAVGKEIFEK